MTIIVFRIMTWPRMIASSLLAATLVLAASPASAQSRSIAVRVRVLHDGAGMRAVSARFAQQRLLTDSAGIAVFNVAAGRFALAVELFGFATFSDSITVARDTTVVVTLTESAVEAEEEIIVTSTRGDRRIQDEPVKVEVVTREEVEEKLLMTPGSISMLLNETPGLRVQETSPALGGAVIRIQGLEGRYTQLLSDGLPLFGGQAGSLGALQIPPMDLAQVEVIKGTASALYGASALGGAINLVSRRPADETELLVNQTTRGGSDAVLWQSRVLSERVGYTALVSGHRQSTQYIDGDGWADLPRYNRLVARPRLFIGMGPTAGMITGGMTIENRTGGGRVADGSLFLQQLDTRRFDIGATGHHMIRPSLQFDARGSATSTSHAHSFGGVAEDDRHTTAFVESSLRGQVGKHYWVSGVSIQRDAFASTQVARFDYTFWIPSLFVQDEIALSDRLVGSFSIRADNHSEYGAFLAPRASTLLRLSDATSLRLTAGRGYYAPTPFTEETEEVGLSRLRSLGSLNAEIANLVSADLNWEIAKVETNVSVFSSRIFNAVDVVERPGELELVNVAGVTRTSGVDALARYRRAPFGITASYTFVSARRPAQGGGIEDVPLVPRHAAGLVAVYEKHGDGRAGIEIYHTGRQALEDTSYGERSRAYTLFGLLVEKRIGRVRAFLNMENLTNVRQSRYQPMLRTQPTGYGRWTTDVWAPIDGRTLNGGIRIKY